MAKTINARLQQKHDTEANWNNVTEFIPMAGEIIVYDKDDNYDYERIKIGDGTTKVNNLSFINENIIEILDTIYTKTEVEKLCSWGEF